MSGGSYVVDGYNSNDGVTYTCDIGFLHTLGDLYGRCTASGVWDLVPPTCSGKKVECVVSMTTKLLPMKKQYLTLDFIIYFNR